jgi:hypothetical protein
MSAAEEFLTLVVPATAVGGAGFVCSAGLLVSDVSSGKPADTAGVQVALGDIRLSPQWGGGGGELKKEEHMDYHYLSSCFMRPLTGVTIGYHPRSASGWCPSTVTRWGRRWTPGMLTQGVLGSHRTPSHPLRTAGNFSR